MSQERVKPANCTCHYPEVVIKNMNGHHPTCPVYLEWDLQRQGKVSTLVTGEVKEHHFRCQVGHEFSIMLKKGYPKPYLPLCPVSQCQAFAKRIGENPAEISKNPEDVQQG